MWVIYRPEIEWIWHFVAFWQVNEMHWICRSETHEVGLRPLLRPGASPSRHHQAFNSCVAPPLWSISQIWLAALVEGNCFKFHTAWLLHLFGGLLLLCNILLPGASPAHQPAIGPPGIFLHPPVAPTSLQTGSSPSSLPSVQTSAKWKRKQQIVLKTYIIL